jgi:hypothetical protein
MNLNCLCQDFPASLDQDVVEETQSRCDDEVSVALHSSDFSEGQSNKRWFPATSDQLNVRVDRLTETDTSVFASGRSDKATNFVRKRHSAAETTDGMLVATASSNCDELPHKRQRKDKLVRDISTVKNDRPRVKTTRGRSMRFVRNRIVSSDSEDADEEETEKEMEQQSSVDRQFVPRNKWSSEELQLLETEFAHFMCNDTLPGWADIEELVKKNPCFANRKREAIKARFVYLKNKGFSGR